MSQQQRTILGREFFARDLYARFGQLFFEGCFELVKRVWHRGINLSFFIGQQICPGQNQVVGVDTAYEVET